MSMRQLKLLKSKDPEGLQEPVKIRPDLNLEKWAIWQPAQSRKVLKAKIIEREIELPNGDKARAKVEIAPTTRGALTTQDQKVFYALIKIWEENGKSITYTHISLKRLARNLGIKWGTRAIETLTQSIDRLLMTHFLWEHSYYNAETRETVEVMETPFTILSERKIIKTKKDGHITREEGYFRFHPQIVKNLHANYTKPVLFEVVISFKSEIAQIIYTQLDLFLANKPRYERRTKELFEDLGLDSVSYQRIAKRKERLEPALQELLGKPLSSGGIIGKATLEQAKTTADYKVVFEKRSARKALPKEAAAETKPHEETTNTQDQELITKLCGYGIAPNRAKTLIMSHRDVVEQQLEYYPYHAFTSTHSNPAGWLIKAIEENYAPPELYQDVLAQREEKQKAAQQQQAESAKRATEAKERAAIKLAEEKFLNLPESERGRLLAEAKTKLMATPEWANQKPSIANVLIGSAAKSTIIEDMMKAEREAMR